MTIIESHNTDKSQEFIHLYNQCYTEQQIQEQLKIGKTAYYNYYKQNQHKLKRTKKCQICGKTFTPKTPKQKYCTQKCRLKVKYYQQKKKENGGENMCYNETQRLLNKYDKQYVPGERPNKQTQKQNRDTRKLLHRLETLNELENKLPFTLTNIQKAQVEHLIRRFNNKFKKLHGNASEKTIILTFIFIIKRIEHPKYTIDRFVVCRENGLNHNIYETIHSRITEELLKIQPLNNTRTYNYNNEILYHTNTLLTN